MNLIHTIDWSGLLVNLVTLLFSVKSEFNNFGFLLVRPMGSHPVLN